MNALPGFFFGLTIILSITLAVTAATLGTWTVQFFARNRRVRLAQQRPLVSYYRRTAFPRHRAASLTR